MTGLLHEKEFSRKSFVKGGGALIVGFSMAGAGLAAKASAAGSPFASSGPPDPSQIDSWIAVQADNTVSLRTGAIELGQGTSVGLSMIAAEELNVDLSQMNWVRMDTNVVPNTGANSGSASIRDRGPMIRAAAASAYQALLGLASASLGVPVTSLTVQSGLVSGGGKSVSYGQLLGGRLFNVQMPASYGFTPSQTTAKVTPTGLPLGLPPGAAPAKPVSQYSLVGTYQRRFDIPAKVTGTFTYVHNVRVPGMVHARLVRPRGQSAYPSGAPVVSIDPSSIAHVPGAQVVREGDFVAVIAPLEFDAIQAAAELRVIWGQPPVMASSADMWAKMRTFDAEGLVTPVTQLASGNASAALGSAAVTLARTYTYSYQGHLPIGPTCCVADVNPNGALVFSNTQQGYPTAQSIATLIGLPVNQVRVVYYEGASCFGASPYDDCAQAASLISKLVGKPVRLQYMRWDEHGWDNYGPIAMVDLVGGTDAQGKVVAHEYTAYIQPGTGLNQLTQQTTGTPVPVPGLGSASIGSIGINQQYIGQQYALPNRTVIVKSLPLLNNYVKQMYLRGVGSVPATFANEQFLDELAYHLKMDPVAFRLQNLRTSDGAVTAEVGISEKSRGPLEAVAKLANWQPKVAASNLSDANIVAGRGVALGGISGTWSGVIADIQVNKKTGKILVTDLWAAEDAGLAVAPEQVRNQMVGSLIHGTSRALYEEVTFNTQRVTSLDWVTYPILRFKDAPLTHVITADSATFPPTGSGEPTLVPTPAAIANAFFDATGVRILHVPMTPGVVRATLKAAGTA